MDTVVGYPKGVDRNQFTLIAPFTKDRHAWLDLSCVNVWDGKQFDLALQQDLDGSKVVPQTFGYVLHLYPVMPSRSRWHRTAHRVEKTQLVCCFERS